MFRQFPTTPVVLIYVSLEQGGAQPASKIGSFFVLFWTPFFLLGFQAYLEQHFSAHKILGFSLPISWVLDIWASTIFTKPLKSSVFSHIP